MDGRKFDVDGQIFSALHIRWSDRQKATVMEQNVELVRRKPQEWTILSPVRISEATPVYLIGDSYTGNGIVSDCRRRRAYFVLSIAMNPEMQFVQSSQEFDPGLLGVDNFLTEEEEAKILESLEGEAHVHRVVAAGLGSTIKNQLCKTSKNFLRFSRGVLMSVPLLGV